MAKTSRKSYAAAQKFLVLVVDFAEHNGNRHAGCQFNVSKKVVHDWQRDKAQLEAEDKQTEPIRGENVFG